MPDKNEAICADADRILGRIKAVERDVSAFEAQAEEMIERIRQDYAAKLQPLHDEMAALAKNLVSLMRSNRRILFDGIDKVSLENGILIYERKDKVTIPRDALGKAIALNLDDAIIISRSLDRATVEKWPDERLELIGATRKPKDYYSYETR